MKDDVEKPDLLINHEGKNLDVTIESSKRDDSGMYKIIILNEVGQAEAVCNVLVYGEFLNPISYLLITLPMHAISLFSFKALKLIIIFLSTT